MGTATRVYLARHGRTALNAHRQLRGLSDPPLDDVGRAEVARLAETLAVFAARIVVCSPLQRAVATARAIGAAAAVEVHIDDRLNDRDYGPQTGKLRVDVERRYGSVDAAPGVEPLATLEARARQAFSELVDELAPGPIVMVYHDAFNRALLGQLDPRLADVDQATACWNQLSLVDGTWKVDAYNRTADG